MKDPLGEVVELRPLEEGIKAVEGLGSGRSGRFDGGGQLQARAQVGLGCDEVSGARVYPQARWSSIVMAAVSDPPRRAVALMAWLAASAPS